MKIDIQVLCLKYLETVLEGEHSLFVAPQPQQRLPLAHERLYVLRQRFAVPVGAGTFVCGFLRTSALKCAVRGLWKGCCAVWDSHALTYFLLLTLADVDLWSLVECPGLRVMLSQISNPSLNR